MLNIDILVIWTMSFKGHKTLSLENQESNDSIQPLHQQQGEHFNKVWVFFSVKQHFPEHKAESRGSPPTSLYEYLKMEKRFSSKCAKKERKAEVLYFY